MLSVIECLQRIMIIGQKLALKMKRLRRSSGEGVHQPEYVNFMNENYPEGFKYSKFAPAFTAEFFDPDQWAEVIQKSGARSYQSLQRL
ncbi:tissue alpha-L-fucosidase-like [Chiloscyllium plagiosum]|uniref:tissue alpha-L-fucosidase-like n=1 Tax=Chiloscyllium plagiosum TaxID=36176 RepID=UPI001CB83E5F|nr:tissue alpha-L-fucosidase-like [Chiloscyllium plagiosum]